MPGPWTTAYLANKTFDDVMTASAAVAMDLVGVPFDLPPGLTVVTTQGQFWCASVVDACVYAGIATQNIASGHPKPIAVDNRRHDVAWTHVSEGRRILLAVETVDKVRPDGVHDLVDPAQVHRLEMGPAFLRAFLRAWYDVDDATLDGLGLDGMRNTPKAWSQFDAKTLASAVFGRKALHEAMLFVRDKLADFDEPPAALEDESGDRHHDHDDRPAKPLGAVAESVVRRLREMTGFGPDATRWGMDLARDLRDWRSGEIAWADVDRGVLLSGPPGCGKTTFARSLALECDVDLVVTGYDQWHNGSSGDSVSRGLNKLFAAWRKQAQKRPVIVLWDEADSVGVRGGNAQNESWFGPIINAWLAFLDGAEPRDGIVVIAATNYPGRIDEALRRPGRLEREVALPRPGPEALRGILAAHLGVASAAPGMDEAALAVRGASPADVGLLVREARRLARSLRRAVTPHDVADAAAASRTYRDPAHDRRIAVHEAAHAVAALALGQVLEHVDVDNGLTQVRYPTPFVARTYLDAVVLGLSAGAAEEAVYGNTTTGREMDLHMATKKIVAYHFAYGWGGTLSYVGTPGDDHVHLTPDQRERVEATMREQYAVAERLVAARLHDVRWLARALRERRYLTGAEAVAVLRDTGPLARGADRRWEAQADEYAACPPMAA